MKLFGKTLFCFELHIQYFSNGVLLHQQAYTRKLLKHFHMDQAHALAAPMIERSRTNDDSYQPCLEEEEEIVDRQNYLIGVETFTYVLDHPHEAGYRVRNKHTRETQPKTDCLPLERS